MFRITVEEADRNLKSLLERVAIGYSEANAP